MGTEQFHVDKSLSRRLLLPASILNSFLSTTGVVLLFTLLLDMASSLNVSIATASQLGLVASRGE